METGKGANALDKRPQLRAALDMCRKTGARLLIAKLDRLARNVAFISNLMESKIRFVTCDLPEANELMVHIMAAFAQHEAKRRSAGLSQRRMVEELNRRGVKTARGGKWSLAQL